MRTAAFGQDFTPKDAKTIRLKKDYPAPFTGQLMTDEVYRFYVNTRDACFITENALRDCQNDAQENNADAISVTTVTAFILGGLSVYYLKR